MSKTSTRTLSSSLICTYSLSLPPSETYMIPSVVKEASGLFTIKSTLYMQPTKADKDSVFQCTVEYSMPGDQNKQKKSDTITINLNCERRVCFKFTSATFDHSPWYVDENEKNI